jgi:hypothetical protein
MALYPAIHLPVWSLSIEADHHNPNTSAESEREQQQQSALLELFGRRT